MSKLVQAQVLSEIIASNIAPYDSEGFAFMRAVCKLNRELVDRILGATGVELVDLIITTLDNADRNTRSIARTYWQELRTKLSVFVDEQKQLNNKN